MDRLDYLMKNKSDLQQFIHLAINEDYDCQDCPFRAEDGLIMGCNTSADNDEIICVLNDISVSEFLEEEMPTEEQMKKWRKQYEEREH